MSVSASEAFVAYVGDGSTTAFPITFSFANATNVKATVDGVAVEVTVDGTDALLSAPAADAAVVIYRDTPVVQDSEYENNETILGSSVETDFDRSVRVAQEQRRDIARAYKAPMGTNPEDTEFESLIDQIAAQVAPGAIADIEAAADQAEQDAVSAIQSQSTQAQADLAQALADALNALGLPGDLFDVLPTSAGYDAGLIIGDTLGWATPAKTFQYTGLPGPLVRLKLPEINVSGEIDAERFYLAPQWYATPTAVLSSASASADSGKYMANESSLTPPSENLFALTTGDIRNTTSGVTITKQAALGPTGLAPNSAVQGVHTTTSAFRFLNDIIPADTWDLTLKVKGTAVGTTNVRRGAASALTSDTVTDSAWKALPRDPSGFVSDGVTVVDYQVRGDGANTPTLLYDQLQGYPTGDTPTWADEMADTPFNWHFKKRLSHSGAITFNGDNEIILTGGVNFGYLQAPSFPAATLIADLCVHIMVDLTAGVVNSRIFGTETASDLTPATTTSTLYIGTNDTDGTLLTGPVNTGAAGANIALKDAGPTIITLVATDGHRGVYVNGQPVNVVNTAHTEFSARLFQMFGASAGSLAPDGAFLDMALRLNQAPTTDDIVSDVVKLIDRNSTRWGAEGVRNHLIYNHDSNSAAGFPAGTRGPSGFYYQGTVGYHTRPLFVTNRALSGSTLVRMKTRWDTAGADIGVAATWVHSDKDAVRAARACGVNIIYGIGASFANDQTRFGTATVAQLIADTKAFAAEIKTETGNPAIILGAIGNNLATADQLAGRDIYEAAMVADSDPDGDYVYVSLAATTLWTWNSTDFEDDIHMRGNSAGNGQEKTRLPIKNAISGLLQ